MGLEVNEQTLSEALPSSAIEQIRRFSVAVSIADGETLITQGEANYPFYVVLTGKVRVSKGIGGDDLPLAEVGPEEFLGELGMLSGEPAPATARAWGPVTALRIGNRDFAKLISDCGAAGQTILAVMTRRSRELSSFLLQREKLAALGKLAAALAHELNNPAAAASRATIHLREAIDSVQTFSIQYDCRFTEPQREALQALRRGLIENRGPVDGLDPMERSDREDEMAGWLDRAGVGKAWELAPTLVSAGVTIAQLDRLAADLDAVALAGAIVWLEATLKMADLSSEVEASMSRITEVVTAMKEYSYMERSVRREIDIHSGLDITLKIFGPKLKHGVEVIRDYDRTLPKISAYPGELNQVWTNLIANAIEAMAGKGRLRIRTARDGVCILVEICDSGPGIPESLQPNIFGPFFTTKAAGKGTGLGLDISRRIVTLRHHGKIEVKSAPGDTRFQVRLPIDQPKGET